LKLSVLKVKIISITKVVVEGVEEVEEGGSSEAFGSNRGRWIFRGIQ
jgi:hypothetical protein